MIERDLKLTSDKTGLLRENCIPELHKALNSSSTALRQRILTIEELQYGKEGMMNEEEYELVFESEGSSVVLLRDASVGEIVGFSYALPLVHWDQSSWEPIEREEEGEKTAYMANIALHPDYVGYKLTGRMMNLLENELRKKGFEFMEMDCVLRNGYADAVERHYRERVVARGNEPHSSTWGEQIFFRIRL